MTKIVNGGTASAATSGSFGRGIEDRGRDAVETTRRKLESSCKALRPIVRQPAYAVVREGVRSLLEFDATSVAPVAERLEDLTIEMRACGFAPEFEK